MKKLLWLCFLSWVFDVFGGRSLIMDIVITIDPETGFTWFYETCRVILTCVDLFWKFGLLVFMANLFSKTRRSAWWIWMVMLATFTMEFLYDLQYWQIINPIWWEQGEDWIFDGLKFATTLGYWFYGGLVLKKWLQNFDLKKFPSFNFKDWYTSLIETETS